MLSRLGSKCRTCPQMKTFNQTLDLFLSMPPPRRGATRGQIDTGLVAMMFARLRTFLLAIMTNHMVHVEWNSGKKAAFNPVPEDIIFRHVHRTMARRLCTTDSSPDPCLH